MDFWMLACVIAAGLLGPLLAAPRGWRIPVVIGEFTAGVILGRTGIGYFDAADPIFEFLAALGFALVMFVVGTHVPVRSSILRAAVRPALLRLPMIAALAVGLSLGIAAVLGNDHWPLYAVLMASSSAALAMPIITSMRLEGASITALLPQLAIADALCIVLLPMAIAPDRVGQAAVGSVAVLAAGAAVATVLWRLERDGVRKKVHRVSERERLAAELRVSLLALCVLCALAVAVGVSIMLAGFVLGLGIALIGNPRRLARQLFAVTEGFLGPVFFVWLGASVDLRGLADHPRMLLLGVVLGIGAIAAHLAGVLLGQRPAAALLAAAQLGLPLAAVTIGLSTGYLGPGEDGAIIVGMLITMLATTLAGRRLAVTP